MPPSSNGANVSNWRSEEVENAAKRLAEFFKGDVIRLSDEAIDFELSETGTTEDIAVYESDIDDDW